ncbi:MAG: cytochrome c [Sphingomonadales bacterium]|nr:cytochrome c [Sphingomonadales bacterium]
MRALPVIAFMALALVTTGTAARPRSPGPAQRGLALAQGHCAACHGVTPNSSSPNPESPTFEDIANRRGLTATTLDRFLRDAHNYPDAMNFRLERGHVRDLSAYIVTLKRKGYKPTI